MADQLSIPWKAIRGRLRRKEVAMFLRNIAYGGWGHTKRDILASAKKEFGMDLDWKVILPVIVAYLPTLLDLLKNLK